MRLILTTIHLDNWLRDETCSPRNNWQGPIKPLGAKALVFKVEEVAWDLPLHKILPTYAVDVVGDALNVHREVRKPA